MINIRQKLFKIYYVIFVDPKIIKRKEKIFNYSCNN